ncbi:hypothetical protein Tco_0897868, partial [Tanacetum coccineum]
MFSETVPFPRRLKNYCCDDWREAQDVKILEAYDHILPQKEKDLGSFTLPCFIHNVCFDKALVDLGESVGVMPFSTYTNLGLGILSHTRLTIELTDITIKQLRGFIIVDNNDVTSDVVLGMPFFTKYVSCQMIMKKFAHEDKCYKEINDMHRYGKMEYCEDEDDSFTDLETEYPAIVFNDASDAAFSCEPTVSALDNNKIDFNISFDESDDEDYMVIFDENSFSCKIISIDNLKTDSENENDKVNMPPSLSPEPMFGYIDDLDFFKDFENEFPAIAYNDLKSKSDPLNEPSVSFQHIDKFETSLSEYDEKEQNVLCLDDSFPL